MIRNFVRIPKSSWVLIGSATTLFFAALAARGLMALTTTLIARRLGPSEFGIIVANLNLFRMFSVIFTLGLDGWLLRNSNRQISSEELAGNITFSFIVKCGFGLLWLVVIAILPVWHHSAIYPIYVVLPTAISILFEEIANTGSAAFKSVLQNHYTLILTIGTQLAVLIMVGLLSFMGITTAAPYVWGRTLATFVSGWIAMLLLFRIFPWKIPSTRPTVLMQSVLPFTLSAIFAQIYGQADVAVVAQRLDSHAAGIYVSATSIINLLFIIPTTLYSVLLPTLSRIHASERSQFRQSIGKVSVGGIVLGIILGGSLWFLAPYLVNLLYGRGYQQAVPILLILSVVLALRCINFNLAAILAASGMQNQRVIAQAIAAIANLSLNLIYIERVGLVGVAIFYVVSELILVVGYGLFTYLGNRKAL